MSVKFLEQDKDRTNVFQLKILPCKFCWSSGEKTNKLKRSQSWKQAAEYIYKKWHLSSLVLLPNEQKMGGFVTCHFTPPQSFPSPQGFIYSSALVLYSYITLAQTPKDAMKLQGSAVRKFIGLCTVRKAEPQAGVRLLKQGQSATQRLKTKNIHMVTQKILGQKPRCQQTATTNFKLVFSSSGNCAFPFQLKASWPVGVLGMRIPSPEACFSLLFLVHDILFLYWSQQKLP